MATKISHFKDRFYCGTVKRARDERGRLAFRRVAIQLTDVADAIVRIQYFQTLKPNRFQGHGNTAMYWLCSLADEFDVTLSLSPVALDDDGMPFNDLVMWYAKFGFKFMDHTSDMFRKPNVLRQS